jgi:hypothetical protein
MKRRPAARREQLLAHTGVPIGGKHQIIIAGLHQ